MIRDSFKPFDPYRAKANEDNNQSGGLRWPGKYPDPFAFWWRLQKYRYCSSNADRVMPRIFLTLVEDEAHHDRQLCESSKSNDDKQRHTDVLSSINIMQKFIESSREKRGNGRIYYPCRCHRK